MNQLLSSLWGFPPGSYVVVYIVKSPPPPLDVASSLSSGIRYPFEGFWSICLKIAQPLVVNFVVFRREDELQSSYSAILIPSSIMNSIICLRKNTSSMQILRVIPATEG